MDLQNRNGTILILESRITFFDNTISYIVSPMTEHSHRLKDIKHIIFCAQITGPKSFYLSILARSVASFQFQSIPNECVVRYRSLSRHHCGTSGYWQLSKLAVLGAKEALNVYQCLDHDLLVRQRAHHC